MTPNYILQGYSHGEELRHDINHVDGGTDGAEQMSIGGDGIGKESLFNSRDGIPEPEAAGPMTNVKDDAALSGLK